MSDLDNIFGALADPTRRAILARLRESDCSLSDLSKPFEMSQTAVSRHVRVLQDAGLVDIEKRGRTRHCRLVGDPLATATSWLEVYRPFWENRLQSLAYFLSGDKR